MLTLLICYFVFLLGFVIFSASGIYHLWRFGYVGDYSKPAIAIYIILSVIAISLTLAAMSIVPWPTTIQ